MGGMSLSSQQPQPCQYDLGPYTRAGATASTYVGGTTGVLDGEAQGGFYGDVTGRLGWTWGPALIYAKGGFAWLNADLKMREFVFDSTYNIC